MRKMCLTEVDEFVYNKEIRPFLPQQIFDVHAHLLKEESHPHLEELKTWAKDPLLYNVDMSNLEQWWRALFPHSTVNGLIMGLPTRDCNIKAENRFVSQSITGKSNRFAILTSPEQRPDKLEREISKLKPAGLKPYLFFAQVDDHQLAHITDFIPEAQIALADQYGLSITLHVSRPRGMADPDNLEQISYLVHQYPRCNFILAHCGRCFITPNMEDALDKLPVAENLWLDTSAVCDIGVFINLFNRYDRTKILFGTDLVTPTGFRGTYVRFGMSWGACTAEMVSRPGGQKIRATFAVYENLRALLHGARFCKLSQTDIENIFYDNAAILFNLDT